MRWSLLIAGLRWRRSSTLSMLTVAVAAIALSVLGPLYLHGADQSILDGTLDAGPAANIGLTLQPSHPGHHLGPLVATAANVPRSPDGQAWFGPGLVTTSAGIATSHDGQSYTSTLLARTGVCRHVDLVAGTCPVRRNTVILSVRSARELGLTIGHRLNVSFTKGAPTASLTVVGLFAATDTAAPYWWGDNYFPFGYGTPEVPMLDDAFSSASTLAASDHSSAIDTMVQLPFIPRSLSTEEVPTFEAALAHFGATSLGHHQVTVSTQLDRVLANAAAAEHTTSTVVWVIEIQLVLLALFTLYFATTRTAAEREADVQLAELRGYRRRSLLAVAMEEPMTVVIVAVPLGLGVGWALAFLSASRLFVPGIGTPLTGVAVAAAAGTAAVAALAVILGSRRLVSAAESGHGIEARTISGRSATGRVVADVTIVAVAVAAFIELMVVGVSGTANRSTNPLAAFAPGLLALGIGVLGARLLPAVIRPTFSLTEDSHYLATTLATRRVARRPEFSSQVILIIVAVALTLFGVGTWAVAARNRSVRNEFEVGAPIVLTVSPRPGTDFLAAVRQADGGRHSAMAVVVEHASDGTTLAVDASRLASVASWPSNLGNRTASQAAVDLIPHDVASVVYLSGNELAITVDARITDQPAPQLSVDLFDNGYQTPEQLSLGPLLAGRHTYTGSLVDLCSSTCRLVDLALASDSPPGNRGPAQSVQMTISSLTTRASGGRESLVNAGLFSAWRWSTPRGGAKLMASKDGLRADVTLSPYQPIALAPADTPSEVPAVVTPTTSPSSGLPGGLSLVGLDGATLTGHPVGEVAALPEVGVSATLVDLGTADRFLSGPVTDVTFQVWLGSGAPGSIKQRLAAEGITVTGTEISNIAGSALDRTGVGLAYSLFLMGAAAAAVLAVGVTAFSLIVNTRRRSAELAALEAVGVSDLARRRSIEIEQFLTVGFGVVFGSVTGIAATALALPSLPEFVASGSGPPLDLGLPDVLLTVTLASLLLTIVLIVTVCARLVMRSARRNRPSSKDRA